MKPSAILQHEHEELMRVYKRMKPEERLVAYFHHSQLMHQLYQAGVNYRAAVVPSSKRKRAQSR